MEAFWKPLYNGSLPDAFRRFELFEYRADSILLLFVMEAFMTALQSSNGWRRAIDEICQGGQAVSLFRWCGLSLFGFLPDDAQRTRKEVDLVVGRVRVGHLIRMEPIRKEFWKGG